MSIEKTSSKSNTPIFLIAVCGLLWLVGFTYSTGFGETYNVLDTTKYLVTIVFLSILFFRSESFRIHIGGVLAILAILYIGFYNETQNGNSIIDYIWVWFLIPIISLFSVRKNQMRLIGFIYGIASTAVLLIGNVTDIFKGWDGNSVSLVQFFSYTIFMSVFVDVKDKKNVRNIVIFSVIYFYLLNTFNSRSAILFSIVMLLCALSVIPLRKWLSKEIILIILLLPLIIALFVTSINDLLFIKDLNDWSIRTFNKTIFNGRDMFWENGFKDWWESPFVGNGNFFYSNYHNSAITTLVAVGGIGYSLLIAATYKILKKGLVWMDDSVVYGLTTSFLIIWMQQSVEQGLISSKPNVIPYLILGLLYARVNTLEGKYNGTSINNSANLQHRKLSS